MFYLPLSPFNFISLLNFFYSLLHNFIIFPPQCFYSLLHNVYYFPSSMFFIPLLHHHLHLHLLISIVFPPPPPPPPPHFCCFPSSSSSTSSSCLLFSLQVWSFRPDFGLLLLLLVFSGAPVSAKRARSGAPWVRKFGYDVAYARPYTHFM